jgi:hypothetical protein
MTEPIEVEEPKDEEVVDEPAPRSEEKRSVVPSGWDEDWNED